MKHTLRLVGLLALMATPVCTFAGDNDDFGTWLELGAYKSLPHHLEVGIEGDLRTENNSKRMDRWNIGASLGYRINKYVKVGMSYQFLDYYTTSKYKDHYNDEQIWNGYKLTHSYWTPKHRINLEASGTYKLNKWLRLSIRERYQFTHAADKTIDIEKHRYTVVKGENGNPSYADLSKEKDEYPDYSTDIKEGEDTHYLRSRLKVEVDKKHLDWSPFISVETHNCINESMHLHKLRTIVGTGYKINRHNAISLSYVLTSYFDEQPHERMHAIDLGYKFDF